MATTDYRAWGPLRWLLAKLPPSTAWGLLGVLGTEDRCVATLNELGPTLKGRRFLRIVDPHSSPASAYDDRLDDIQKRILKTRTDAADIRHVNLLQDIDTVIEEVELFLEDNAPNVVLDITSMPKRWFFPLIRFLTESPKVENLIVTYASASHYGEQLSSDLAQLAPLPTFDEPRTDSTYDELIVGVGFAPLGLKDLFEADIGKIRYLFPFPPGPPNFYRNWHFLRTLDKEVENRNLHIDDRWHVHMYDVSNAFEALRRFTKDGIRTSALAPFGPKTLSLAMCLFALAAERKGMEPVHVFYTQPRRYALDYTTGIKIVDGFADIKAYCIKLSGRNLYSI